MTEDLQKIMESLERRKAEILKEMERQIVVIVHSEADNLLKIELEIQKINKKRIKNAKETI